MKPVDATEMKRLSQKPAAGLLVWTGRLIAGLLLLLLFSGILVWLLRKPIAERALEAWCADRDLTCDAKFTRISANGATLTGVKIASGGAVPAEAREVRALLSWPGFLTLRIDGVTISGLEMRGTLDPSGLKFYGLERLAAPTGTGTGTAPPLEIRDARIFLSTPFGPAAATLNVVGRLPEQASLSLAIDPARLSLDDARLSLTEGRLTARISDGQVTSELHVTAEEAAARGYAASGFSLAAEAAFPFGADGAASLEWSARLAAGTSAAGNITGLRTRGRAEFDTLPNLEAESLLGALTLAVADAGWDSAAANGWSTGPAAFNADLEGSAGLIRGPLVLEAAGLEGPPGAARELRLAGDVRRTPDRRSTFTGGAQLNAASLSRETLAPVLSALQMSGDFAAHGASLSTTLNRAARDFDTAFGLRATFAGGSLLVEADGPAGLAAASGMRLDAGRPDGQSWLVADHGGVRISGDIRLSGGGAPDLSASIGEARISETRFILDDVSMALAPWTAGERTISARLSQFAMTRTAGEITSAGQGEVSFTGEIGGVDFSRTRLSGGVTAMRDETGWRVQSDGAPCLGLASDGIAFSGVTVPRAAFDICPVDGRFIRQGSPLSGAARLGNVSVPLVFSGGEGTLGLEGALADWSLAQGFRIRISADTLSMPMTIGERTLSIDSGAPEIHIATATRPARIEAGLGETRFGGSLIPANVSARDFRFAGTSAPGGLSGDVRADGVLIRDINRDAIYEPVTADFTGRIEGQRLIASGPVLLEGRGNQIAVASADINIFDLDGTAHITSQRLVFFPGGLQPAMLSRRLVGLFTDAGGEFNGEADFTIDGGRIDGTADLAVTGLGFQTTRLGRVEGVTGEVRFDDLMALTTARDQALTIGSINPGVPFTNGRVVFSFEEGEHLQLASVTFPFAGGDLALAPLEWSLGGGTQSVEVTASRIDLTRLIEVLKLPDTRAEGTVSGSFPIEFTQNTVIVRDARLRTDAGGGRLSYTGAAVNAAAEGDPTAAMAFNALRDMEYSVLEVGLSGDLAGQMQAQIVLAGRNVRSVPVAGGLTMPPGQAFEFNMGFNLPLAQLIQQGLQSASASNLLEVVTRIESSDEREPE
ncbi:MAG: YdbH domain-containing protein [Hyphomonas sp.]